MAETPGVRRANESSSVTTASSRARPTPRPASRPSTQASGRSRSFGSRTRGRASAWGTRRPGTGVSPGFTSGPPDRSRATALGESLRSSASPTAPSLLCTSPRWECKGSTPRRLRWAPPRSAFRSRSLRSGGRRSFGCARASPTRLPGCARAWRGRFARGRSPSSARGPAASTQHAFDLAPAAP